MIEGATQEDRKILKFYGKEVQIKKLINLWGYER
jgi:hypothetical protein